MDRDRLAAALDAGVAEGVLPDEADRHAAEVRTARTWLFLLGYMRRNSESGTPDGELVAGLNAFRRDSGVPATETDLDAKTLSMLRRLMCFDADAAMAGSHLGPRYRFSSVAIDSPALLRAVAVRLYALDFLAALPGVKPDRKKILTGLKKFAKTYSLLGLGDVAPIFDAATITALFDPDPVLEKLRGNQQTTAIWHPHGSSATAKRRNREMVKQYVNALARIELWLIGYLSRPRKHMWSRDNTNRSLPSALRAFWRDQPENARPRASRLEHLDGSFFARVQAVMNHPSQDGAGDEAELQRELLKDADLAQAVRKESLHLGARLLDGLVRAARFVIGWIRMRLRRLIALARNMASLIAAKVRGLFGAIRDVVFALQTSWRFLVKNPVPGSDPAHLLLFHDSDFDFVMLRNPHADAAQVSTISGSVGLMAQLLAASAHFVGQLIDAFVMLGRRSGLGGWFGVLLVLHGASRWLDQMGDTLHIIRSLRGRIEAAGV